MTVVSNDAADQSADYDVAIVQQPDRHWSPIENPTACVCLHSSSPNNNKTSKVSDSLMMIFTFIGRKQQPATEWQRQRQRQQQRRNHLLFSRSEVGNLCFCFDLFNKVFVCWFIWRYEGKRKSLLNVNIMWGSLYRTADVNFFLKDIRSMLISETIKRSFDRIRSKIVPRIEIFTTTHSINHISRHISAPSQP